MCGSELKRLADAAGVSPIEVCHEAGINSPKTLYKVYNDESVKATTRVKVEQAILRLSAKMKQAVAG